MLFALCLSVEAQQSAKVPRIGYLSPLEPVREASRAQTIRLALRELGWIEGQNIAIEYRYAEGKRDRQPELADFRLATAMDESLFKQWTNN
jgi:putative ABC transport system substrate-binding protein